MDHVGRVFGNPDFRLPRNRSEERLHEAAGVECRHEHEARYAAENSALSFTRDHNADQS